MSASNEPPEMCFGFVQVIELGDSTLIGGYLLLNALGRPIEFHCTEPVSANRAQRILYGPTLKSFLGGEQIARTLVEHCKLPPRLVFVDEPSVLALRSHVSVPVVLVSSQSASELTPVATSWDVAGVTLSVDRQYADDRTAVETCLRRELSDWDFLEPFDRISEAMRELQKAA